MAATAFASSPTPHGLVHTLLLQCSFLHTALAWSFSDLLTRVSQEASTALSSLLSHTPSTSCPAPIAHSSCTEPHWTTQFCSATVHILAPQPGTLSPPYPSGQLTTTSLLGLPLMPQAEVLASSTVFPSYMV